MIIGKTTLHRVVGELIDTLWNVNESSSIFLYAASFELIDTLWNVNGFIAGQG